VKVAVSLGAGASADAGIPMTVEMVDAVLARLSDPDQRRMFQFVRHTLAANLALAGVRFAKPPRRV
jgi:hypothetical protein